MYTGLVIILTGFALSVYGEFKILPGLEQKDILIQRMVWHVCAALLLGIGGIVFRMAAPNMKVICVERILSITGALAIVAIIFSFAKHKMKS